MTTQNQDPTAAMEAELEVVGLSAIEALQRAEIDVQIATAHKFPRSLEKFKRNAVAMATMDEETAASCIYRRPVGKENGKPVYAEGLSVRTAEIVGACYGNLRVYTTTIENKPESVTVRGMAHDLESNFASSSEVTESCLKRDGTPYDPRMRLVILKAAHSKARRDATFQVVPKALASPIEEAVRKVLVGDAKSMERRRAAVKAWIDKLGIDVKRVYSAIGVEGPSELTADHLETLTGLKTAIRSGETKIEDAFPPIIAAGNVGAGPAAPQKTATELAAEEEAARKSEAAAAGPKSADLKKQIIAKGASINAGRKRIESELVAMKTLSEDCSLDDMSAAELADVLHRWDEIAERILGNKPE